MKDFIRKNGAWLGLFALFAVVTLLTSNWAQEILTGTASDAEGFRSQFFSVRNLTNLIRQAAINGILASGMTVVILTGGIDLSIGSLVAFTGVLAGISQVHWGWADLGVQGAVGSFLVAVAAGAGAGCLTGGLVSWLGIPPFVITLGMMVVARGVALILSNGTGISPMGESLRPIGEAYLEPLATTLVISVLLAALIWNYRRSWKEGIFPIVTAVSFGFAFFAYKGLPYPVLLLTIVLAVTSIVLNRTTLGRSIYAIGSNEIAAHWAGVPVKKVKWIVYTLMGFLAGAAGVLLAGRLNSAVPTAGALFELDAIAAVVIGGTSLKGGTGSIMGSLVGALMIATLDNGMDLLAIPSFYQMVLKGVIIIVAVALDKGQRQT